MFQEDELKVSREDSWRSFLRVMGDNGRTLSTMSAKAVIWAGIDFRSK